jgi:3-hydroxyisobutyrate dehydrogenase/2-hydroxy-3-oxopropionate reductase
MSSAAAAGGRVAVLGLGLMGAAMAGRLLGCGHRVAVWDRSPGRIRPLATAGAVPAGSPAAAATGAAVVLVAVTDVDAVRTVVLGPAGAAAGLPRTIVQTSTVGPDDVRRLAADLPADVALLDTPVLGSVPDAAGGTLRLLVGGAEEVLQRHRPVLAGLGEVVPVGPVGAGSAVKLVLNATVAPMVALLADGLALADRLGLDEQLVLDELERSRIGPLVRRKRGRLETGRYPAESRLGLFGKDLQLVLRAAADCGVPAELVAAAAAQADAAIAAGLADLDYSALVAYRRGRPATG